MSKGLKGLWILLNLHHFFNTFSWGGGSAGILLLLMHNLWNCPVPRRQETSRTPNFSCFRQFWCLELCPEKFRCCCVKRSGHSGFLGRLSWFWGEFGWGGFSHVFFCWYPRKRAPCDDMMPLFFWDTSSWESWPFQHLWQDRETWRNGTRFLFVSFGFERFGLPSFGWVKIGIISDV